MKIELAKWMTESVYINLVGIHTISMYTQSDVIFQENTSQTLARAEKNKFYLFLRAKDTFFFLLLSVLTQLQCKSHFQRYSIIVSYIYIFSL